MSCMQYFFNLQIRVFVQKISVFTRVQTQWDTQGMEYPKIPLKLHLKYGAPRDIQVLQKFGDLTHQLRAWSSICAKASARTRKECMPAMVSWAFLKIHIQSVQFYQSVCANSTTVFVQFCHSICANSSAVFVHCLKQYLYNYTSVFVQVLVTRVCSRRWWVVGRPRRKPTKSQLANTRFQVHCSKRKHEKLEILKFII